MLALLEAVVSLLLGYRASGLGHSGLNYCLGLITVLHLWSGWEMPVMNYNPGQNLWDALSFSHENSYSIYSPVPHPTDNVGCQESNMCHKPSKFKDYCSGVWGADLAGLFLHV